MNPSLDRVKYEFVRYTRGTGLDLGHGPTVAFPHMLGVRETGTEHAKPPMVPCTLDTLASVEDGTCDFIVAAAVLHKEGIAPCGMSVVETANHWLSKLKPGGHLCIFEPARATVKDLKRLAVMLAADRNLTLVRAERFPAGGTLAVIRLNAGLSAIEYLCDKRLPKQTACVVRHGGIGDQLQAAFVLPQLKREGFHVTMLTTPKGRDILQHDPNIDEWFMVDKDQVPGGELPWFWQTIAPHYDRFVNLNESVEGTFLPSPGRTAHAWPITLRQEKLGGNYAEHAAKVAQVPFVPEGRFHASAEETQWVNAYLTGLQRCYDPDWIMGMKAPPIYTVLWSLAGSSPHKFTPHQDTLINAVIKELKRAVVILVGDEACKILESGWEEEPRVRCESGQLSIRQTLALAQRCNLVIGPETGTLNAVCYEPAVAKVVMLSHSSHENLTKHWLNTTAIPGVAACYPCHQLHITAEYCDLDEKFGNAARCQSQVNPNDLYHPIWQDYTGWSRVQLLRSAA